MRTDVSIGIGDDAAAVHWADEEELLLTTDTMVEGVHFLSSTMSGYDIGWKCVIASISDIAAMGGQPRHILLSLALSKDYDLLQLERIYDGIADACRVYDCSVIGGDVVGIAGPIVITSTLTGAVPRGQALRRSGAKPGDVVFVTGNVGGSAAGLAMLKQVHTARLAKDEEAELISYHQHPFAQVTAGQILRTWGASSCNDISDGLASELNEISQASGVRLRIMTSQVPLAPAVRNLARQLQQDVLEFAWYGGEDYQLVGTASPFAFARALAECESVGIQLRQIGRVEIGDGVVAVHSDGRLDLLNAQGFNHFRA